MKIGDTVEYMGRLKVVFLGYVYKGGRKWALVSQDPGQYRSAWSAPIVNPEDLRPCE